jgi:type I restriction enzyme S subunit
VIWVEVDLEKHIKFIDYRGKTPNKTNEGLRLITAKNIKKGVLQKEPEEFVSADTYASWMTRGIPKKGDILFTTEAPLGNVAQLDTDEKVVFAQRIIIMQPDERYLYADFLKYLLLSPLMQEKIASNATGATATGIKASILKKIKYSLPSSLLEQKRIVAILDEAFAGISQAIANTEKNLANAQELFENYLLTLFKKYKTESEGKKFKDVVTIINGRNQKDVLDQNGSYPVLGSAGNIMGHATDFLCRAGTTIIGRKGNISKPIFIDYEFWNVDTAFGLVPNNNYLDDKFFFHYCLQYNFLAMNRGTTIPSLVKTDLLEIPIYYPDLAIQKEESKKTDSIFNQMELYNDIAKQKLQALAELKQSLLQKAFSGDLTANNVDKWVNP